MVVETAPKLEIAIDLVQQNRLAEAEPICLAIIKATPTDATAWHLLGVIRHRCGDPPAAREAVETAIRLDSGMPDYYNTLGIILAGQMHHDEAVAYFKKALSLRPRFAEAVSNIGLCMEEVGRLDDAIACYRQAIALKPRYAEAYGRLGNVLRKLGRPHAAVSAYRQAIEQKSRFPKPHHQLGHAHLELGQLSEATTAFRERRELQPDSALAFSDVLLSALYDDELDTKQLVAEHMQWGRRHGRQLTLPPVNGNDRNPDRRLRIGYVSPDFRNHPVPKFMLPIFSHHNSREFEIFGYAEIRKSDAVTERIRNQVHHWRDLTDKADDTAADLIRRDQIDILVDLAGHMPCRRLTLFALRAAPIQVAYCGYPFTTGTTAINYRLTDALVDPPGKSDELYSERLARLNRCCWSFEPGDSPEVAALPATSNGHVTFAALNRLAKIRPKMVRLWAEILKRVPNSRLLIKTTSEEDANRAILASFVENGIPADRLMMVERCQSQSQYMDLWNLADIGLDTFPYHGTATTCEATWMGVPTITLAGDACVSRTGVSLLNAVGLQSLVANTPEQYVATAVDLATKLDDLSEIRATLRGRMKQSPLMDHQGLTREIEARIEQCGDNGVMNKRVPRLKHREHMHGFILSWLTPIASLTGSGLAGWIAFKTRGPGHLPGCGEGSGCAAVTASRWSQWMTLPVSATGSVVYLALSVNSVISLVSNSATIGKITTTLTLLVAASAIWFIFLQLAIVRRGCLYCNVVHAIGFIIFVSSFVPFAGIGHAIRLDVSNVSFAGAGLILLITGQVLGPHRTYAIVRVPGAPASGSIKNVPSSEHTIFAPGKSTTRSSRKITLRSGKLRLNLPDWPLLGSSDALTIIAFVFDYACPVCRPLHKILEQIVSESPEELAVALIPVPQHPKCNQSIHEVIPGYRQSCQYARLALSLWISKPERYREFDSYLFADSEIPSLGLALRRYEELAGTSFDLRISDERVETSIARAVEIFNGLNVKKLPNLLLPDAELPGMVDTSEQLGSILARELKTRV